MSATPAELSALVAAAAGRPILVVGDVMLDHFVIGRVDRISPEAPVPVVCFEQEQYRLGGAANVAHNVAALGASVELLGVVGDDEPAAHLRAGLRRAQVRGRLVVSNHSEELDAAAERGDVVRDVGGAAEAVLLLLEADHRDRRFRRNALDAADDEVIQHHVEIGRAHV